jgi:hypothetical protein
MTRYFQMTESKTLAVSRWLTHGPSERAFHVCNNVRRICLEYPWPNEEEHQDWLNTAPADEIGAWVESILQDEGTEIDGPAPENEQTEEE